MVSWLSLVAGFLGYRAAAAAPEPLRTRQEPKLAAPTKAASYAMLAAHAQAQADQLKEARAASYRRLFQPAKPPAWIKYDPANKPTALAMDGEALAKMALDNGAFSDAFAFGNLGAFSEAVTWLGYPVLAELCQRSEYRLMTETIAKEMTRRWIKLQQTGDDPATADRIKGLEEDMEHFKLRDRFRRMAELDGFFGRGHLYIDTGKTDDDEELRLPLPRNKYKIKKGSLKNLKVVEPTWTYPGVYNSDDPLRADFYAPRTWFVFSKQVHASRMLTFISRPLPDLLKPAYAFGGVSLSQLAKPYVDNWLRTRQSVSDLIHSFSVSVLKTNMDAVLQDGGASDNMVNRALLFNIMRDTRGLMMVDKNSEEFANISTPLGTLDKLQAQSQEQMASVSHTPLLVLLGITPTGLNASTDGEMRQWEAWVKASQEHLFAAHLKTCLEILQLNKFGEIDPGIGFEFQPLHELSRKEELDAQKTEADRDAVYVGMGAIGPEEVRERISNSSDLPYSDLDPADMPQPLAQPGEPDPMGNGLLAQPDPGAQGLQEGEQSLLKHAVSGADMAHDADSKPVKRYNFDGILIGIETPKGEIRRGNGWECVMPADYGYIMRTKGRDDDRVDCFVGPYLATECPAFIIEQINPDSGIFDEFKLLLGFQSAPEAAAIYDAAFSDGRGPDRRGNIQGIPFPELRGWLRSQSKLLTQAQADYGIAEGDDFCQRCRHYMGHRACDLVIGEIDPDGWCKEFDAGNI